MILSYHKNKYSQYQYFFYLCLVYFYLSPSACCLWVVRIEFSHQHPAPFAHIGVFWGTVIVQLEDLLAVNPHPEVITTHPPGPAVGSHCRVLRLHVARHPSPPLVIDPFGEQLDDPVSLPLPDEGVWAAGFFLQGREPFKMDGNLLVDKVQRLWFHF